MSDNNELSPVGEITQQPVADNSEILAEVERLRAHNQELLSEKIANRDKNDAKFNDMEKQLQELRSSQSQAKQAKLVEQGKYEPLWKEASATNSSLSSEIDSLKQQLENERVSRQTEFLKAKAISAFQQAGIRDPEHMYFLRQDRLRLDGDSLVALDGGVQTDLGRFIDGMRQPGSRWEYMFQSSGARGMSATGSSPTSLAGKSLENMSLAEKVALEMENPDAFKRLQAQKGK